MNTAPRGAGGTPAPPRGPNAARRPFRTDAYAAAFSGSSRPRLPRKLRRSADRRRSRAGRGDVRTAGRAGVGFAERPHRPERPARSGPPPRSAGGARRRRPAAVRSGSSPPRPPPPPPMRAAVFAAPGPPRRPHGPRPPRSRRPGRGRGAGAGRGGQREPDRQPTSARARWAPDRGPAGTGRAPSGCDWAGTVEGVGAGVSGYAAGDRVWGVSRGIARDGAAAESIVEPAELCFPIPEGTSFVECGGARSGGGHGSFRPVPHRRIGGDRARTDRSRTSSCKPAAAASVRSRFPWRSGRAPGWRPPPAARRSAKNLFAGEPTRRSTIGTRSSPWR